MPLATLRFAFAAARQFNADLVVLMTLLDFAHVDLRQVWASQQPMFFSVDN
jgi:hypothetical protein